METKLSERGFRTLVHEKCYNVITSGYLVTSCREQIIEQRHNNNAHWFLDDGTIQQGSRGARKSIFDSNPASNPVYTQSSQNLRTINSTMRNLKITVSVLNFQKVEA